MILQPGCPWLGGIFYSWSMIDGLQKKLFSNHESPGIRWVKCLPFGWNHPLSVAPPKNKTSVTITIWICVDPEFLSGISIQPHCVVDTPCLWRKMTYSTHHVCCYPHMWPCSHTYHTLGPLFYPSDHHFRRKKTYEKFHPLYQSRNPLYQSITIPPTIAHQIKSRTISVYIPPESIDISRSIEAASCWRTWPPRRHDFGCPWSTWWWKAGSGSMELAKNSWISPGKMRISWWIQWDFMMLTGKISFWWLRFAHLRQLIWSYLYQSISRCIRN